MDNSISPQAIATLETLLLDEVFAPMSKALGPLGSVALQPFDAQLARLLERS